MQSHKNYHFRLSELIRIVFLAGFSATCISACSGCDGSTDDSVAGTGGTPCGDGILEAPEACDDGNTVNGDGCSKQCVIENSCDIAEPFDLHATDGTGLSQIVTADLSHRPSMTQESCGGAGREYIFAYTAESAGVLSLHLTSDDPLILAARSICGDSSFEQLCVATGSTTELRVAAEQVTYLIVDAPAGTTGAAPFTLSATLLPIITAGGRCDGNQLLNVCDTGFRCEQNVSSPTCVANTAPVLQSATALRTGRKSKDLYIAVAGTDAEGDVTSIVLQGLDDNGVPVSAATTYSLREDAFSAGPFTGTFAAYGYFTQYPTATSFVITLKDSGALLSAPLTQTRADAPIRDAGASCDKNELVNLCATGATTGYRCPSTMDNPTCVAGASPVLTADRVAYFVADAYGNQRLVITGSDDDSDLEAATLEFLDDSDQPVAVHFSNGTTTSSLDVAINNAPNTPELAFQVNASMLPITVTKVAITLKDHTRRESERRIAVRGTYPEKSTGATCDTTRRFDHCAPGLACTGTPTATCSAGAAPTITRAAYLHVPEGDFVLIEGNDADRDLATVQLNFFNSRGDAVTVFDANGDGAADQNYFIQSVAGLEESNGDFFLPLDVSRLSDLAPKIGVTLTDFGGLTVSPGDPLSLSVQDTKATGEACSLHGFDQCESGTRCSANELCTGISSLREAACTAADPALLTATPTWTSSTNSPSLWDPPAGCAADDPHGAPEGVGRFVITSPTNTVVISTNHAGTTFDTILYVVAAPPACNSDTEDPVLLNCNDDTNANLHNYTSEKTLTNLPVGTYLVIVDSYDAVGGTFELSVDITQ